MQRSFKLISFICKESIKDILIAELSLIGYDSFLINDIGFEASILDEDYHQPSIDSIVEMLRKSDPIHYYVKEIQEKNWNKEWERNYNPIVVDDYCRIQASFHNIDKIYPIEIKIDPRMSFGTGHHETTHLMIQQQLNLIHTNKRVLDAGCGTGILSILAERLGAAEVVGFDIDHWAYKNAKENLQLNECKRTLIIEGNHQNLLPGTMFDIILANINLNVIIKDINSYCNFLKPSGFMILSGFYSTDFKTVDESATNIGLTLRKKRIRNKWLSLVYYK